MPKKKKKKKKGIIEYLPCSRYEIPEYKQSKIDQTYMYKTFKYFLCPKCGTQFKVLLDGDEFTCFCGLHIEKYGTQLLCTLVEENENEE